MFDVLLLHQALLVVSGLFMMGNIRRDGKREEGWGGMGWGGVGWGGVGSVVTPFHTAFVVSTSLLASSTGPFNLAYLKDQ